MRAHSYRQVRPVKSFGLRAVRLLTVIHEHRLTIFSIRDLRDFIGLEPKSARNFAEKLVRSRLVARLERGLFVLAPLDLGAGREHLGNPYAIARQLAGRDYYVSHVSAMALHGMAPHRQLVVHATNPYWARRRTILGTEFRFVRCKPEHMFGLVERWVGEDEKVVVSDLERTIVDGLKQPEYCGGIAQVANGFLIRRADVNMRRLVDYVLRLDVEAVIRRLGFLLEACGVDAPEELERLRARVCHGYCLLDPTILPGGRRIARWRLRLNIDLEARQAVSRQALAG